jgi:hypothetical protein
MINVTNVDRSLRARTIDALSGRNRNRFRVAGAGIALAVVAGLAAPVFAASSTGSADAAATTVASTPTTSPATGKATTGKAGSVAAKPTDTKKAATKAKKSPAKKAPSYKALHPKGIHGGQLAFKPSKSQLKNAREIVKAGQKLHLSPRAQVIAVATSLQESTLHNYGHLGDRNDHDSQGLFQQRPSAGWGTPKQITNPRYAATAFYKKLVKVDGWKRMNLTDAAQAVQVSAFPNHYAKWEKHAGNIVSAFYGAGPYAKQAATLK